MELVVFVGIPASGKSTESRKYRDAGYTVLSSDAIRCEIMNGVSLAEVSAEEQDRVNKIVFETVYAKTEEALRRGESVVVDSTHIKRRYRMDFLRYFEGTPCTKKCVVFVTPFETCLERNRKRTGFALVPEEILLWMFSTFECPYYWEGWDEIIPVASDAPSAHSFPELENFAYGTPEYDSCRAYSHLLEKFCGHTLSKEETDRVLYETNLINCRARPSTLWSASKEAFEQDKALFGERFVAALAALNEAECSAQ